MKGSWVTCAESNTLYTVPRDLGSFLRNPHTVYCAKGSWVDSTESITLYCILYFCCTVDLLISNTCIIDCN